MLHQRRNPNMLKLAVSLLLSATAMLLLLAAYMLIRACTSLPKDTGDPEIAPPWSITLFQERDIPLDDILLNLIPENVIGTEYKKVGWMWNLKLSQAINIPHPSSHVP